MIQLANFAGLPFLILLTGALLIFLAGRLLRASQLVLGLLTALICLITLISLLIINSQIGTTTSLSGTPFVWGSKNPGGSQLLMRDWSIGIMLVCLGIGFCVLLFASVSATLNHAKKQIMSLILLSFAGLYGLLMAADLFSIYLFSELMCISATGMIMSQRRKREAINAAFKYLIMGSAATLIMLLGLSLAYKESGQILIGAFSGAGSLWARIGAGLFLIGLGLKIGFVPLHGWLPDAYEHAPNVVTSLLAGFLSTSALFVLPGICLAIGLRAKELGLLLLLGSLVNMFVGNITALTQKKLKRRLAYSSIAYTGYMMFAMGLGLFYDLPSALGASMFLFIAHACMKTLAFISLEQVKPNRSNESETSHLLPNVTFGIAIAGLASIPPLAGFTGKWNILISALDASAPLAWIGLSVLLLNSLLALGYYLPMLNHIFSSGSHSTVRPRGKRAIQVLIGIPLVILAVMVIWVGVQPTLWMNISKLFKVP